MPSGFKEIEDGDKRGDVIFGRTRGLRLQVGVTLVDSYQKIFHPRAGLDRKTTSQVRGSPVRAGEGKSIRDSVGGIVVVRRVSTKESLGASDGTKSSGWCVGWLCGWDGRCLGGGP